MSTPEDRAVWTVPAFLDSCPFSGCGRTLLPFRNDLQYGIFATLAALPALAWSLVISLVTTHQCTVSCAFLPGGALLDYQTRDRTPEWLVILLQPLENFLKIHSKTTQNRAAFFRPRQSMSSVQAPIEKTLKTIQILYYCFISRNLTALQLHDLGINGSRGNGLICRLQRFLNLISLTKPHYRGLTGPID